MKKFLLYFLFIFVSIQQFVFAVRNDYHFDISPIIDKPNVFSVGLGGRFYEYNSWFQNGRLNINSPSDQNISKRELFFSFAPFFQVRPLKIMEFTVSSSFLYQKQDYRNDITGMTNAVDGFDFESISASAKFTLLNWYLSIAAKVGISYNFAKNYFLEENKDPLNIYGTVMFAVIPKVIPLNFLFSYTLDTRDNLKEDILKYGEIMGAFEIITSPFINLTTGVNYIFPYSSEYQKTYVEPFVKIRATVSDFLYMNVSFQKVVWGSGNAPNTATFNFSMEYMFYTIDKDWWSFEVKK